MPKPPGAAWRVQPATRRGSWTAQLDRCSIKQKRKNDQTVVPPGGGTVEDNGHPDKSIWGESSLHQTRGAPAGRAPFGAERVRLTPPRQRVPKTAVSARAVHAAMVGTWLAGLSRHSRH